MVVVAGNGLTLLVGCGLLLRTIYALRHVPLGFRTDHVMVANMSIPAYKYAGADIQRALYQPLLERVQHLPGVQSAALMTEVPLGKTFNMMFTFGIDGKSAADVRRRDMRSQFRAVSPDMQKVFGFRMLRQFPADHVFRADQNDLGHQFRGGLNRSFDLGLRGVISAHGVHRDCQHRN